MSAADLIDLFWRTLPADPTVDGIALRLGKPEAIEEADAELASTHRRRLGAICRYAAAVWNAELVGRRVADGDASATPAYYDAMMQIPDARACVELWMPQPVRRKFRGDLEIATTRPEAARLVERVQWARLEELWRVVRDI